jgi:hypothetical protein
MSNYGEALKHLASILDKAQGVTCIETGKQIDIGREVLKLRGILDEFQAIADTHRIVRVELLARLEEFAVVARDYYSAMTDDVCQSYSEPWQQGVAVCKEVRAIIDNEEQL